MWKRFACALVVVACCVVSSVARAQVSNPTRIAWDYSAADHALVTRYQIGYYLGAAADPFMVVDVPKASVAAEGAGSWGATLPRPAFGTFTVRLRGAYAVAGGGEAQTDWSNATGPFSLSPPAIAGVRLVP